VAAGLRVEYEEVEVVSLLLVCDNQQQVFSYLGKLYSGLEGELAHQSGLLQDLNFPVLRALEGIAIPIDGNDVAEEGKGVGPLVVRGIGNLIEDFSDQLYCGLDLLLFAPCHHHSLAARVHLPDAGARRLRNRPQRVRLDVQVYLGRLRQFLEGDHFDC
jgi:hypothetical protein